MDAGPYHEISPHHLGVHVPVQRRLAAENDNQIRVALHKPPNRAESNVHCSFSRVPLALRVDDAQCDRGKFVLQDHFQRVAVAVVQSTLGSSPVLGFTLKALGIWGGLGNVLGTPLPKKMGILHAVSHHLPLQKTCTFRCSAARPCV